MRIPAWLRIAIIIMLLSIIFSILGAVSEVLIPAVFILALIMFPGPDQERPRLVRWAPALWGFSFLAAWAFVIAGWLGKSLVGPEADVPTTFELWSTIISAPILSWAIIKRDPSFKTLLVISTVIFFGQEVYEYSSSVRDAKALFELIGESAAELMLSIYLFKRFKPKRGRSA